MKRGMRWMTVAGLIAVMGGGGCQAFLDALAADAARSKSSSPTPRAAASGQPAAGSNESWARRAEPPTTRWLLANRPQIATSIVNLTHPSGRDVAWGGGRVIVAGDMLQVRMTADFTGSWSRQHYQTTVIWEFSRGGHQRAVVHEDNAPVAVSPANARQLDTWFRSEMYAKLRSQLPD